MSAYHWTIEDRIGRLLDQATDLETFEEYPIDVAAMQRLTCAVAAIGLILLRESADVPFNDLREYGLIW